MTQIKLRRDVSSAWTSSNPILGSGEPGFETDTGKFKIGDGSTNWNNLAYSNTLPDLSNLSDAGKIANTNNCWPSTTVISLTPSNGGSYVAPANGWFIADAVSSTTNQSLVNLTGRLGTVCYGIGGAHVGTVCQAAKGETIRLWMSNTSGATLQFRYAQGSESEAS